MDVYGLLYVFNDMWIFLVFTLSSFILIKSRFSAAMTGAVLTIFIGAIGLLSGYLYFYVGETFALTQMPLTAYVPMIICIHILSRSGMMQTAAAWSIGILEYFCLKFLDKLLSQLPAVLRFGEPASSVISIFVMAASGTFLLAIVFRYVRKPFQRYAANSNINWFIPGLSIFLIFILFSYFSNSVTDPVVFALLFFTASSMFLVICELLLWADRAQRAKREEDLLTLQMESQRRQYEEIRSKYEMGRAYRHDMRHHLVALDALIQQSDSKEAAEYIQGLRGQFDQIQVETFCQNVTVNAVLSFYIRRAREAGCKVKAEVKIPEFIPFEEMDLCIVLSNALENAIHACEKLEEKERYVKLKASFEGSQKMVISVENPCADAVEFDADGFPAAARIEGHGIGLRSIQTVVKKYNGLFSCNLEKGVFYNKVVMFQPRTAMCSVALSKTPLYKKACQSVLLVLIAVILSVNMFPEAASAMEGVPVIGSVLRILSLENYRYRWGDTAIDIEIPTVEMTAFDAGLVAARGKRAQEKSKGKKGKALSLDSEKGGTSSLPKLPVNDPNLKDAVNDFNEKMADYIEQMKEEFLWYVARKYDGYVGLDTTYTILCNDEEKLILRFDTTLNAGGSGQYSRCFTMDKREKKVIELKDLFRKNASYVPVVSKEILKQMQVQVDSGTADYFIPGGIWREDEWFKEIDGDQNFYINKEGKLVIVFDEYEVAPGSMGCPEFVIPTAVIKKLLKSNSLIK